MSCHIQKTRYNGVKTGQWPASDRALFADEKPADDPFAEVPPMAEWSAKRRSFLSSLNGLWLAFLSETQPQVLTLAMGDRFTQENVAAFDATLAEDGVATSSRAGYLEGLLALGRAASPTRDWEWLERALWKIRQLAKPVRHKPVVSIRELFEAGVSLMDAARATGGRITVARALDWRNGLVLALWAVLTLRLKNFVALDIDRHLVFNGDAITVLIPAEEIKARKRRKRRRLPFERLLPERLNPYLHQYLNEFREKLPDAKFHSGLWPSGRHRRPVTASGMYKVIKKLSYEQLGVALSPHNVRHSAGTSTAIATPIKAKIAMAVLDHADLATGSRYYNMATSIDAQRKTTANLLAVKKRLRAGRRTRAKLRPRS